MADGTGGRLRAAIGVPAVGRLQEAAGGRVPVRVRRLLRAAARGLGEAGARAGGAHRPVAVGESADVGVPVREAYDQWLEFLEADGDGGPGRARILWPARGRRIRVTDRIRDDLVAWSARDARGTARGVATFHGLAENLTRVLVVLEYRPGGLLERAGNLWHVQARRTRLDLADFQRSVIMRVEVDHGGTDAGGREEPGDPAGEDEYAYEADRAR
ncbi:hypothetical protein [Streptomyces sp. DH37]|uniref:hypothetical protein n=1 Tax=Streptomyces sp. DH37 TaxID=3040122 RepID=UPI0024431C84|nr:hypothetical protein [Streptomyces sp. DH37]MDG9705404.1 hypothetical protein [Streptomyces sp. DH37]